MSPAVTRHQKPNTALFIGHIGVALAARSRWPRIPLGLLVFATLLPDVVRLLLGLVGMNIDPANTFSHSLPWLGYLAVVAGLATCGVSGSGRKGRVVTGLVVLHAVFDMISGTKPLWRGGPIGFDLNGSSSLEFLLEATLLFTGWSVLRHVEPWRQRQRLVLGLLLVLQLVVLAEAIPDLPGDQRCVAYPLSPCTGRSWLTKRWPAHFQPEGHPLPKIVHKLS